jgi:hypothetical protein
MLEMNIYIPIIKERTMTMDWQETFSGKNFISDLGAEQRIEKGDDEVTLSRYAAWVPIGEKNHQIIEISDDLHMLMEKYSVPQDRVCTLV